MAPEHQVRAWRPEVPGIAEVLHARMTDHAYPLHAHATWTLLMVDDGAVRYDLERHGHSTASRAVTLLPPHVPHNGRAATGEGFRKRVLYLDTTVLDASLIGRAVDLPDVPDPLVRRRVHELHLALAGPADPLEAESRLSLIGDRLTRHLRRVPLAPPPADPSLAHRLRDLLDARLPEAVPLTEAARILERHPAHLVRAFTREFGMPPHRYLVSRRVDLARALLLRGLPPAEAAQQAGFHDQSHLTRHFRRITGTTPARFAS